MINAPRLQVLIATFGSRIKNIPLLPVVPGVAYLIGWQQPEGNVSSALLGRADISVIPSPGIGSSRNRNYLLDNASSELLLMADDDLVYDPEGLAEIISSFEAYPQCQMLTFRHDGTPKQYPDAAYDLLNPLKGTSPAVIDIAVRRNSAAGQLRFDERFGIGGSLFSAAEDDIFMLCARQARIPGRYMPITICTHPGPSTGQRCPDRGVLQAWGAYIALAHPVWQWPVRLLLKAYRLSRSGQSPFWPSLRHLLTGLRKL